MLPAHKGIVPLSEVLGTGLFNLEKAQSSAGWLQEIEAFEQQLRNPDHHHHHHHHQQQEQEHWQQQQQEVITEEAAADHHQQQQQQQELTVATADEQRRQSGAEASSSSSISSSSSKKSSSSSGKELVTGHAAAPKHRSEAEEYGISSWVYYAQRPFHPERLMEVREGS